MNQRELKKRIVAIRLPDDQGYKVKHDIFGELSIILVPTLELAGCIVHCLRQRQQLKAAALLLRRHMEKKK